MSTEADNGKSDGASRFLRGYKKWLVLILVVVGVVLVLMWMGVIGGEDPEVMRYKNF